MPHGLPALMLAAVAVRLALLPLSHTWDGQTWDNAFAQLTGPGGFLAAVRRPYETMRELSLLTQAAGHHSDFYEGWAYPPLMLYVYWPLAHLYTALAGPVKATYPVQPAFFASTVPPLLALFVRLPNIAADVASLWLLSRLGAVRQEVRWYAFNPLVLLIGLWTFDSVMVAFLLLAIFLAERRRWAWAGVALALGGATKYVPLAALPALAIAIVLTEASARQRALALARTILASAATLAVLIWPVWDGLLYALRFHAERFALGLTVQQLWRTWAQQLPNTDWQPRWQLYASATVGDLLLPLALLAVCTLLLWRPLPFRTGALLLVAAFLAGSKLVNEPYALAPVALLTAELARRPSPRLRDCRTLVWVVALAYAAINMPLWSLSFSTIKQLVPGAGAAISTWTAAYRVFINTPEAAWPFALLGAAFTAVLAATIWFAWNPRPLAEDRVRVAVQ